ncbi:uncharacterized protein LOC117568481 [Drosophila albomicans]|uniref:Uncharacterized protein LOC117568481 n=1 Tax=Drosophila albomicans TaxID=7291 RepID=A0A6P8WS35_DROAB|nr:uncharacterized protein LOC117568481 [Drosophila albomicans]
MDYRNLDSWYKGKCHAPGIIVEEEAEITENSEDTHFAAEEPDYDLAYDELESIKGRLLLLRSKLLITPPDPCEQKYPIPLEDESFRTPNQQLLLQLRRSNCVLKCQLQKLMQHLQTTRSQIKVLEAMRGQLNKCLGKMTSEVQKFQSFQQKAIEFFGICLERHEQVKMCKVDNEHFGAKVQAMMNHTQARLRYLVPMRCHNQLHYDLSVELILIRIFLHSLFSNMIEDWNHCKRHFTQRNWCCSAILPPVDKH